MQDKDPVLSDLAQRFINRKLFKAIRLPTRDAGALEDIQRKAGAAVSKLGLDPNYYLATESTGLRPYDYYRPEASHPQTEIMVRTESGDVRELSTLSGAVEALVKGNYETFWLIYPDEATEHITSVRELAPVS